MKELGVIFIMKHFIKYVLIIRSKTFALISKFLRAIYRSLPLLIKRLILTRFYLIKSKKYRIVNNNDLPLPKEVFFELRTKCNGRCSFCAASIQTETRPDTVMEFELFNKVINELEILNYSGRVGFHVNNEPLIVPDLEKYIIIAREKLPNAWIQILTNGRSLTLNKADSLMQSEVNEISINHYNDKDFLNQSVPEKFITIKNEVIAKYYPKEYIKQGHGPENTDDKNIFRYNIFLRRENEILTNRAGTAPNKKPMSEKNILGFCERPFTQFNITTDGKVSQCCDDLYFDYPMGNLKKDSILDIWYGKQFEIARKSLLKNNRDSHPMCKTCDFIGVKGRIQKLTF